MEKEISVDGSPSVGGVEVEKIARELAEAEFETLKNYVHVDNTWNLPPTLALTVDELSRIILNALSSALPQETSHAATGSGVVLKWKTIGTGVYTKGGRHIGSATTFGYAEAIVAAHNGPPKPKQQEEVKSL